MKKQRTGMLTAGILLFVLFTFCFLCSAASAEHSGSWGTLRWVLSDEGELTISGSGSMRSNPGNYPWLSYQAEIQSVVLEEGVTSVAAQAFSACENLTLAELRSGVKKIEKSAFESCPKLSRVTLPDTLTDIGDHAFNACGALSAITLPASVTTIGELAFFDSGLTAVTIPDSVTTIEQFAFGSCASLTSITIPGVIPWQKIFDLDGAIRNITFTSDVSLTMSETFPAIYQKELSVHFTDRVKTIGSNAFAGCSGMKTLTIPAHITSVGAGAFADCSGLTEITIPGGLETVAADAFLGCSGITAVHISGDLTVSLKSVYAILFSQFTRLQLLGNVSEITEAALLGCREIRTITVSDDNPYLSSENGILMEKETRKYRLLLNRNFTSCDIPNGTRAIGNYAFSLATQLETITVPDSVMQIDDSAFVSCNATLLVNCGSYGAEWAGSHQRQHEILHAWGRPSYSWAEDYSHVTGTLPCERNEAHTVTETVTASGRITTPATYEAPGVMTYTSAAFSNARFSVQTVTVEIPRLIPTPTPVPTATPAPTETPAGTPPPATPTATPGPTPEAVYTLTVRYEFTDGSQAAEPYIRELKEGEKYTVKSPAVQGCTPDKSKVTGKMGAEDVSVTVVYRKDQVTAGGGVYRLNHTKKTAEFQKAAKASAAALTIGSTVKGNGIVYKVTSIAASACKGMKKLKSVTIGADVKTIGKNAFSGCAKLKSIVIKTKLLKAKNVGANAFKGVYSKSAVTCPKGMAKKYRALLLKKGMPKKAVFK